jgi:hypothetical protein
MTTESDDNPVASSLGKTTLSDWIGFAKIALPVIGIAIPVILFPVEHYLDSREDTFRESLQPLSVGDVTAADIAEIKEELSHLEGEIKGDLRSSPTTIENMQKLADLRERVVRLEAILDRDRRR